MQQDQLLTKEGTLKMAVISNAVSMNAINEGEVRLQLVKGRKKANVPGIGSPKNGKEEKNIIIVSCPYRHIRKADHDLL